MAKTVRSKTGRGLSPETSATGVAVSRKGRASTIMRPSLILRPARFKAYLRICLN